MGDAKCLALKTDLAEQPEPQIVPIVRFFDGNDDLGSIGCNLIKHPGINKFRDLLIGLLRRPDVEAVYAQISELDSGDGSWPFTDTVLVVGSLGVDALRDQLSELEPDEISPAEEFGISSTLGEKHSGPVLAVWWD